MTNVVLPGAKALDFRIALFAHPFRPKLHLRSERGDESNEDRLIVFRSSTSNLDDSLGSGNNSRFRAGASLDGDRMVSKRYKGRDKVPSQYTKLRLFVKLDQPKRR
jgi:hypothetical protein